jgi:hypothetical protein
MCLFHEHQCSGPFIHCYLDFQLSLSGRISTQYVITYAGTSPTYRFVDYMSNISSISKHVPEARGLSSASVRKRTSLQPGLSSPPDPDIDAEGSADEGDTMPCSLKPVSGAEILPSQNDQTPMAFTRVSTLTKRVKSAKSKRALDGLLVPKDWQPDMDFPSMRSKWTINRPAVLNHLANSVDLYLSMYRPDACRIIALQCIQTAPDLMPGYNFSKLNALKASTVDFPHPFQFYFEGLVIVSFSLRYPCLAVS